MHDPTKNKSTFPISRVDKIFSWHIINLTKFPQDRNIDDKCGYRKYTNCVIDGDVKLIWNGLNIKS